MLEKHVRSPSGLRINSMKSCNILWVSAMVIHLGIGSILAEEKSPTDEELKEATKLQVFLDRANFGPGKIDGRYGDFTHKALNLYLKSQGKDAVELPPKEEVKDKEGESKETKNFQPLPDLKGLDMSQAKEAYTDYEVTEADAKLVGELPKTVPAMAKLKWLPYASLSEAVAEKFHCDLNFFKELNPKKFESLKVGDVIKVPNVESFDVNAVKDLPLLDLAMNREDADNESDKEENNKKENKESSKEEVKKDDDPKILSAKDISVKVDTKDSMVKLYEKEKLVAAYPVTIGSDQTKSPQGDWKVRGIARLPDFRYDRSFLKTGERGDKTYLLPPGPNNMVGVIWVALNRRGIGLHGTNEPDSIGRSASHGCIRLANWDITRLAMRLRGGVSVSIH